MPRLVNSLDPESLSISSEFLATFVDFSPGGVTSRSYPKVSELLGDQPPVDQTSNKGFKWLHLPVNNMRWVEVLMFRYEKLKAIRNEVLRKDLWEMLQYKGSMDRHLRFIRPLCREIQAARESKSPHKNIVLFMPYIHWETEKKLDEMKEIIRNPKDKSNHKDQELGKYKKLIQAYLNEEEEDDHPLHIRRTLDQYYYTTLQNTTALDKDQVVSRHFERHWAKDEKVVMMVDQLWLWVLGDTVITSFPQRWSRRDPFPDKYDHTDVLESIWRNPRLSSIEKPYQLAELITSGCLRVCLDPTENPNEKLQFLEFYENSISYVANKEAECFKHFADGVTPNNKVDLFDIEDEIQLLREIKDIRAELDIISVILGEQHKVLQEMEELKEESQQGERQEPSHDSSVIVERYQGRVTDMGKRAEETYLALKDLVDLKQKQANVSEARESRKQGNAIIIFTIVTVIFLPMSFMAAFFAINIAEFQRDSDGELHLRYVVKYILSISAAVIMPFVVFAFEVNQVVSLYRKLRRDFRSSQSLSLHVWSFMSSIPDRLMRRGKGDNIDEEMGKSEEAQNVVEPHPLGFIVF